jgi:hypothetical protein
VDERVLGPGDDLAEAVRSGGSIRLKPGTYRGGLFVEKSVEISGENAVIDAGGRGPAVHVTADDAEVVLRGLVLTGGHAEKGGGVRIDGSSDVVLLGCEIRGNRGSQGGPPGLGATDGRVRIERCTFGEGQHVQLGGVVTAHVIESAIDGDLRARERAQVVVEGGLIGGVVHVRGTSTRAPRVTLRSVSIGGGVENDEELPGEITGG